MAKHVLITGATGLIGQALSKALLADGILVSHLSREKVNIPNVQTYLWNVEKGEIDEKCLEGVDSIIHLAGEGVADKRWTKKRKQAIMDSRVRSTQLIYDLIKRVPNKIETMVSASAIGYYGDGGNEWLTEQSDIGNDFLAHICNLWEQAIDEGQDLAVRVVKLRTGVVLDKKRGALAQLAKPVKFGVGAALGSGKQWVPWIHLDDVVGIYKFALANKEINGVYNMVSPNPVTNKELTKAVAKQLKRPFWLPNVPAFLLKLALGEMSVVVLASDKVSPEKIKREGYQFKFGNLQEALKDIYG